MSNYFKTKTCNGLGTFSFIADQAGARNIKGKITLPNLIEGNAANSQVVVTVNLNGGATIYTGNPGDESFATGAYAAAGDTFNVVLTSSQASDQGLLAVKSTISIY